MPSLLDFEYIKFFVENNGYFLLSKKYINSEGELILKDKDGYKYSPSWDTFRSSIYKKSNLSKFHVINKFSVENLILFIRKEDVPLEYLGGKFINMTEKNISFRCICGKSFNSSFEKIVNKKHSWSCPSCAENKRTSARYIPIDKVKERLKFLGLEMTDESSYRKIRTPFEVRCLVCNYVYYKTMLFHGKQIWLSKM